MRSAETLRETIFGKKEPKPQQPVEEKKNLFVPLTPEEKEKLPKLGRIIILGSGPAGIMAAMAALKAGYKEVILMDPNKLGEAPQRYHIHAFSVSMTRALVEIDSFTDDLAKEGGRIVFMGTEESTNVKIGGKRLKTKLNLETLTVNRNFVEKQLMKALKKMGDVTVVTGYEPQDLLLDRETNTVKGLRYSPKGEDNTEEDDIYVVEFDHVHVATGRNNPWFDDEIKALGYKVPEEKRIDSDALYSTVAVSMTPKQADGLVIQGNTETPKKPIASGFTLQGNDPEVAGNLLYLAMIVQVGREGESKLSKLKNNVASGLKRFLGIQEASEAQSKNPNFDKRAPRSVAAFLELMKKANIELYNFLTLKDVVAPTEELVSPTEELVSPTAKVRHYTETQTVYRRYDDVENFPEHLTVGGDAFLALNPRYGQGMEAAKQQAEALLEWFKSGLSVEHFMAKVKPLLGKFYFLPKVADSRFATTEISGDSFPFGMRTGSKIFIPLLDWLSGRFPTTVGEWFLSMTNNVPYKPFEKEKTEGVATKLKNFFRRMTEKKGKHEEEQEDEEIT